MSVEFQVTFDAADPVALSRFWAAALGYDIPGPPDRELAEDEDPFEAWAAFLGSIGVPEERWTSASALDPPTSGGFIVMADPEGNEFCLD